MSNFQIIRNHPDDEYFPIKHEDPRTCMGYPSCGAGYATDRFDFCLQRSPSKKWVCTKKKGHAGVHVACQAEQHNLEVWD